MTTATLPNLNQTGDAQWEDVEGNDRALRDVLNGNIDTINIAASGVGNTQLAPNAVTTDKILDGTVTDTDLASSNNSVYRTLFQANSLLAIDAGGATYILDSKSALTDGTFQKPITSGVAINLAGAASVFQAPRIFDFDDADFTVGSKTQKLRLRAIVAANATAPGINFTFGLYPVTVAGAADALAYTLGTVVPSSTLAINTPSASTVTRGTPTADFTIPSDGAYALGVVTSGTLANNSAVSMHAILQTRNV